jgi:two-component system, OmpR family, response regulator
MDSDLGNDLPTKGLVLIVEDDSAIRQMVTDYLSEQGFTVCEADSAAAMEKHLSAQTFDLVLLDLNLPDQDGLSIARRLREELEIPVIIITGRKDDVDRIMGLELGADDYVPKPFNLRELLARIRAVLRRSASGPRMVRRGDPVRHYEFNSWELSTGTRRLKKPTGEVVELTNGEYSLLVAFLRSPRKVLTRDQLLELSRLHDDIYDRSIDVQILRIRRKIEMDPSNPEYIRTERGAGYFFNCDVETR